MHIVAIILGAIGFILFWYWRLKQLGDVAKDGQKALETVANLPRKMRFKHRSGKGGLDIVDDPREAATIIMLEVAQARSALTAKQSQTIRSNIMRLFEFDASDAEELVAQAGWLSRDAGAAHVVVRKMATFISKAPGMGNNEFSNLDRALLEIAECHGEATVEQIDLIEAYRNKTLLRH